MSEKSPYRLLRVLFILVVLLIPVAVFLISRGDDRTSNRSAIRKLEQEARRRGEPLTLAELEARYAPIPDAENAAVELIALWTAEDPPYWQAFAKGDPNPPERPAITYDPDLPYLGRVASKIPRVGPLDSNLLAAAEDYLSANASHIEQVRAALRRPHWRFPMKITDGPDVLLPHLGLLRTEAKNFRIIALVASERRDRSAAILALKDVARTGQILADEPVLISQLTRLSCQTFAVDGVEQLLSRQQLTAGELEQLRLFLEDLSLQGVARSALVNERPYSLSMFDPAMIARAATNTPSTNDFLGPRGVAFGFGAIKSVGVFDPDRRLMLETFREAIALLERPTPESLKRVEDLIDKAEASAKASKFPPRLMSSLMLPSLKNVAARFAAYEARRQAALTAIAVERFRLVHGGLLPETLVEMVPSCLSAIPSDPFDGQPLRFRKLERGFVVYSIGRDREDNGGQERKAGGTQKTDITFIVER